MNLSPDDFNFIAHLLKKHSGIDLSKDKQYLVESRLLPVIRNHGMDTISTLVTSLKLNKNEATIQEIVEAMTTNETSFFRDLKPFNLLKEHVLPHVIKHNSSGTIRIWSAACATGQEAYSIAMTLLENKELLNNKQFTIDATDINSTVIEKASKGVYSQFDVQRGLPISHLVKYFTQVEDEWCVSDELKKHITFSTRNLMDNTENIIPYDIIFCRNVLIYFNEELKKQILEKLAKVLATNGILFLGSAEYAKQYTAVYKEFNGINSLHTLAGSN